MMKITFNINDYSSFPVKAIIPIMSIKNMSTKFCALLVGTTLSFYLEADDFEVAHSDLEIKK